MISYKYLPTTVVIILFAIFSYGIMRTQYPSSVVNLSSDQRDVASWAAAYEKPSYFNNDPFLHSTKKFSFWSPWFVKSLIALKKKTGSYANAYAFITPFMIFIFLTGFYLFCKQQKTPLHMNLALTLALGLIQIPFPLGGAWNLSWVYSAVPKNISIALLPWILLLTYYTREKIRLWPLTTSIVALMFYIHQVTPPIWGISILLSFVMAAPKKIEWRARFFYAALSAIAALAIALKGLLTYVNNSAASLPQSISHHELSVIISRNMYQGYYNMLLALRDFTLYAIQYITFLPLIACFISLYLIKKQKINLTSSAKFTLWLSASIISSSLIITAVDHLSSYFFGREPFAIDIIRNLRYWPFLLVLIFLQLREPLNHVYIFQIRDTVISAWTMTCISFGIAFIALLPLTIQGNSKSYSLYNRYHITNKKLFRNNTRELINEIDYLSNPGDIFYGPNWIRFTAYRPVAFAEKDLDTYLYADKQDIPAWYRRKELLQFKNKQTRLNDLARTVKPWGVRFIVTFNDTYPIPEKLKNKIIYTNHYWTILKI